MKNKGWMLFWLGMVFALCSGCQVASKPMAEQVESPVANSSADGWEVSTPEDQGVAQETVDTLFRAIDEMANVDPRSVLIVRNGSILAEKYYASYQKSSKHVVYSCTKSVISALIGIAIQEGLIGGVDQTVLELLPDDSFQNMDAQKAKMTLEDLLTMRSGLEWVEGSAGFQSMYVSADWVQFMMDKPLKAEPGTTFQYCSGCSHVLSGILQEAIGMPTQVYAKEKLFTPLGIENVSWDLDSSGNAIGGWGLEMTTRDMAKFGYLFLQNGLWDGNQVIDPVWIQKSTQVGLEATNGWHYGYQWWVDRDDQFYAARGLHGQGIFVIPDLEMVIVVTAGKDDAAALGDLVVQTMITALR